MDDPAKGGDTLVVAILVARFAPQQVSLVEAVETRTLAMNVWPPSVDRLKYSSVLRCEESLRVSLQLTFTEPSVGSTASH